MSLAQEIAELLNAQLPPPRLGYPHGYPTAEVVDVYCKEDTVAELPTIKRHLVSPPSLMILTLWHQLNSTT